MPFVPPAIPGALPGRSICADQRKSAATPDFLCGRSPPQLADLLHLYPIRQEVLTPLVAPAIPAPYSCSICAHLRKSAASPALLRVSVPPMNNVYSKVFWLVL